MSPHISVLGKEWLSFLNDKPLKIYVDGTLGAGGHALLVLENHPEIEQFVGIDQDPLALSIAKERLAHWKPLCIRGNFSELTSLLHKHHIRHADAILLDIGVSSMHLDQPERGFSFMHEGPLDMRMDPDQELTAAQVVMTYSEKDLGRIFREYGEEKRWRRAAAAIVEARSGHAIETTRDLVHVLKSVLTPLKGKSIHPMTLLFQALRIEVNQELRVLEHVIPQAIELLNPQGILGIITFHSLEDRMVKQAFLQAASDKESTSGRAGVFLDKEPSVKMLTRKPVVASEDEVAKNPRSRSAKLRVIEKL